MASAAVCVELVGEPGIGKTTLLGWLREEAAASGAHALGGRGSEFEHDVPFGILVDALDGHLRAIDDRWSRGLDADVVDELRQIFPALEPTDEQPRARGLSSERFRAYRAVRAMLECLAATRPLVLVLDDVHWADSSSAELLGALLRRPPSARVLIALAYRPHQTPDRLTRELAAAASDGVLQRIELGPLSGDEAEALMTPGLSGHERAWLRSESGGNPFYLRQLVASRADPAPTGHDLGAGVPLTVAAALFSELEVVSPDARLLARATAVAGHPFDIDLAAYVAELDRPAALAALDELVGVDLLRPDGGPLGFAFRHPLVRRAVYESARHGWRVVAHARADALMAERGASASARAHHVEQSASVGDDEAIDLLLSAASEALVPAASARWLRAALRLAGDGARRLDLLCRLGEALAAAGQLAESNTALTAALQGWPVDRDPDGRIEIIMACAQVDRLQGRFERARLRLESAAREVDDPGSAVGVSLAIEQTFERLITPDYDRVPESAERAMRGATALGDPLLLALAMATGTMAEYARGDLERARAYSAQASDLLTTLDEASLIRRPHVFFHLGWGARLLDRYESAAGFFERGVTVARAAGRGLLYVELTAGLVYTLVAAGRLVEARVASEEAVEAARLPANPQPLAWALMVRCATRTWAGSLDDAIADGREAGTLEVDRSLLSAACGVALGVAIAESGNHDEAIAVMLEAVDGPDAERLYPLVRPWVYEALTHAEVRAGRIDRADAWARRARALVDGIACDLPRAYADRAAARVLLARGDGAGAAEHALAAADRADGVQGRVEAARSRLLAGCALVAAGQRARAGLQLRAAEEQLAACGAHRLQEECVRELRRIGLRVGRPGRRGDQSGRGVAALSGREREVADLVRARHTNREIAGQLFLSEKTIESHLRSVFVKLGVSSRADVARVLDA